MNSSALSPPTVDPVIPGPAHGKTLLCPKCGRQVESLQCGHCGSQLPDWQAALYGAAVRKLARTGGNRTDTANKGGVPDETGSGEPVTIEGGDNDERYSPSWLAEGAREVMAGIDLDPASCAIANQTVRANRFFSREANGLMQDWEGRVFLNPPYSGGIRTWIEKLCLEMDSGRVQQAVVVLPADMLNAVTCKWFRVLLRGMMLVPDERIRFLDPNGRGTGPRFGAVVFYLGKDEPRFIRVFGMRGIIMRRNDIDIAGAIDLPATAVLSGNATAMTAPVENFA